MWGACGALRTSVVAETQRCFAASTTKTALVTSLAARSRALPISLPRERCAPAALCDDRRRDEQTALSMVANQTRDHSVISLFCAGLLVSAGLAASTAALAANKKGATRCSQREEEVDRSLVEKHPRRADSIKIAAKQQFVVSQQHLIQPTDKNPTPTSVPPPIAGLSGHHLRHRHVTSVIGLPLRGKAHTARRLKSYLEFFHGAQVGLFDINDYLGPTGNDDLLLALTAFFEGDSMNESATSFQGIQAKHVDSGRFAIIFPSDTIESTESMWSGHSKWRRRWMKMTLESELQAMVSFIEIQVDTSKEHTRQYMELLEKVRGLETGSIMGSIKAYQERYCTIQADGSEDDFAYIQLMNYNEKVVTNNMMRSFLGSRMAQFLASVHPYRRTIFLSRHGESVYNLEHKIGGDSALTPLGREYGRRLAEFAEYVVGGKAENLVCCSLATDEARTGLSDRLVHARHGDIGTALHVTGDWKGFGDSSGGVVHGGMRLVRVQYGAGTEFVDAPHSIEELVNRGMAVAMTLIFVELEASDTLVPARLWTSSMRRTNETASFIRHPTLQLSDGKNWRQLAKRIYRNLDEVYAGEYEGLTYAEVAQRDPKEASLRKLDKLGYRYPRGESYYDVIARLDDIVRQLETYQEPTLIISHQALLRMLYAFLEDVPREQATESVAIPLHTVIRCDIDPTRAVVSEMRFPLGPSHPRFHKPTNPPLPERRA